MNLRHWSLAAAVVFLAGAFRLLAANPEDFSSGEVDGFWRELWKSGGSQIKEPKLEKLSEPQVVEHMAGNWTVLFGVTPDKLAISLGTNRMVTVSGHKDGAPWKKSGQWRVISDKLVLFLKEDDLPGFVFLTGRTTCIFDPWAKTMMSELKRQQ